jgi:hypothetical protein
MFFLLLQPVHREIIDPVSHMVTLLPISRPSSMTQVGGLNYSRRPVLNMSSLFLNTTKDLRTGLLTIRGTGIHTAMDPIETLLVNWLQQ